MCFFFGCTLSRSRSCSAAIRSSVPLSFSKRLHLRDCVESRLQQQHRTALFHPVSSATLHTGSLIWCTYAHERLRTSSSKVFSTHLHICRRHLASGCGDDTAVQVLRAQQLQLHINAAPVDFLAIQTPRPAGKSHLVHIPAAVCSVCTHSHIHKVVVAHSGAALCATKERKTVMALISCCTLARLYHSAV